MKYLVSAAEMRRYDNNTIDKIGIPAMVLMERAALAAVERIKMHCEGRKGKKHVLILAGMGNNGGDGLAVARLLAENRMNECSVEVWCVGNQEKASAQWKSQRAILEHYPVKFVEEPVLEYYDVIVDALFGVGLSREVAGEYAHAIKIYNALEGWKLALDLPSGIDSDTGRVWGVAVRADETVTFGFVKRGLVLYPGCEYTGLLHCADIGITKASFFGEEPEMFAYDEEVRELLPKRNPAGNKGTFGKVLLVAGSLNMAGASILAARGAYRAGAGMVKVITHQENRTILQQAVPEALLGTYEDLAESISWADVLVIGPGLGMSEESYGALKILLSEPGKPLVVDADGLNLLAKYPELKALLAEAGKNGRDIILTPHVGELARLAGCTVSECKENLWVIADKVAEELHAVVAAKDARTFICAKDAPICLNVSGNSGMATAGSGDVLAGIIGALAAQGMSAYRAASVGAYNVSLHSCLLLLLPWVIFGHLGRMCTVLDSNFNKDL